MDATSAPPKPPPPPPPPPPVDKAASNPGAANAAANAAEKAGEKVATEQVQGAAVPNPVTPKADAQTMSDTRTAAVASEQQRRQQINASFSPETRQQVARAGIAKLETAAPDAATPDLATPDLATPDPATNNVDDPNAVAPATARRAEDPNAPAPAANDNVENPQGATPEERVRETLQRDPDKGLEQLQKELEDPSLSADRRQEISKAVADDVQAAIKTELERTPEAERQQRANELYASASRAAEAGGKAAAEALAPSVVAAMQGQSGVDVRQAVSTAVADGAGARLSVAGYASATDRATKEAIRRGVNDGVASAAKKLEQTTERAAELKDHLRRQLEVLERSGMDSPDNRQRITDAFEAEHGAELRAAEVAAEKLAASMPGLADGKDLKHRANPRSAETAAFGTANKAVVGRLENMAATDAGRQAVADDLRQGDASFLSAMAKNPANKATVQRAAVLSAVGELGAGRTIDPALKAGLEGLGLGDVSEVLNSVNGLTDSDFSKEILAGKLSTYGSKLKAIQHQLTSLADKLGPAVSSALHGGVAALTVMNLDAGKLTNLQGVTQFSAGVLNAAADSADAAKLGLQMVTGASKEASDASRLGQASKLLGRAAGVVGIFAEAVSTAVNASEGDWAKASTSAVRALAGGLAVFGGVPGVAAGLLLTAGSIVADGVIDNGREGAKHDAALDSVGKALGWDQRFTDRIKQFSNPEGVLNGLNMLAGPAGLAPGDLQQRISEMYGANRQRVEALLHHAANYDRLSQTARDPWASLDGMGAYAHKLGLISREDRDDFRRAS